DAPGKTSDVVRMSACPPVDGWSEYRSRRECGGQHEWSAKQQDDDWRERVDQPARSFERDPTDVRSPVWVVRHLFVERRSNSALSCAGRLKKLRAREAREGAPLECEPPSPRVSFNALFDRALVISWGGDPKLPPRGAGALRARLPRRRQIGCCRRHPI